MPGPYPFSKKDADQVIRAAFDDDTQRLRVDAAINVDANQVDISAADGDNIAISDGVDTLAVNPDGSINTVLTGATQIEISAADGDNIAINDGTNALSVNPDGSINVIASINSNSLSGSLRTEQITITDIAQKVPAIVLVNRQAFSVRILGSNIVYFGDSAVTSSTGYPKFQYEELALDIDGSPTVDLWAVCATGQSSIVAVMEIA